MQIKLISISESEINYSVEVEPDEFESALVFAYRSFNKLGNEEVAGDIFLTNEAYLERKIENQAILSEAVNRLFLDALSRAEKEYGFTPLESPVLKNACKKDDGSVELIASVGIYNKRLILEGLKVSYSEIVIKGDEIDRRLSAAKKHYGVDTDDKLARRMRVYDSASQMRGTLESDLERHVAELNARAKEKAVSLALIDVNDITASDEEIESYLDSEINLLRRQAGDVVFEQSLGKASNLKNLRSLIRKEQGYIPSLNRILDIAANRLDIVSDDQGRLEEIKKQSASVSDKAGLKSPEVILAEIKKNQSALALLDGAVRRKRALDYAVQHSDVTRASSIFLEDVDPVLANGA